MVSESQRLLSYVPEPLWLSNNIGHATPWSEPLFGAVLFADISGFTALIEQAAQQGQEGGEKLSDLLYSVFGQIAALIHDHGGDVLEYAGDAVIAVFQSATDDIETALLRAALAARVLPSTFAHAGETQNLELSMRIGIGSGDLLAATVGGNGGRRLYVVAGKPLDDAAEACNAALRDEILLSVPAREQIGRRAQVEAADDGRGSLKAVTEIALPTRESSMQPGAQLLNELRPYILDCVQQHNSAKKTRWLAEFRHVNVLFAAIDGIDYGKKGVLGLLHDAVGAMQNVVTHFEGEIVQLLADDKGTVLLAAWGLPGSTHEDDAGRAVESAMKMWQALLELDLRGRIGVTRGQVFCGERGGDRRRDYAMLGNKVNLAARLMQHATQSVLCDEATVRASRSSYTFEPDAVIKAKGFSEPIATFRPISSREKQVPKDSILIGREQERELLAPLLQDHEGNYGLVLEGEAGIGKSALIGYAIQAIQYSSVRHLIGIADVNEKSTAYFIWRKPIIAVLGAEGCDALDVYKALQARLADFPTLAKHCSLLEAVLGMEFPDPEHTMQLTAARRAEIVRNIVVLLLREFRGRQPLLLILDDVHWMDTSSWSLARAVFERVEGIRLLLATRTIQHTDTDDFTELRQMPAVNCITLQPLAGEDVLKLAAQKLAVESLPSELVKFLLEKSGGNPFFAEELVISMVELGHIEVTATECKVINNPASLNLPDTVQGIVASRIDRLDPDVQLSLKVASVIGRTFAYRTLHDVHPMIAMQQYIKTHLEQLESRNVTQLESPQPRLSYIFRHAITQEVTYEQLSFSQRRMLHKAVAKWFESHHEDDIAVFYPLLAHHWVRADESQQAVNYLQLAGEQAVFAYANREAIRFFAEADSLVTAGKVAVDLVDRSRWHWLSGRAYLQLADNANSRMQLHRSLALLNQRVPSSGIGRLIGIATQIARINLGRPINHHRGIAPGEKHRELIQAAGIHHDLGEIAYFDNDLLGLAFSALRSINLAEATRDDAVIARSLTTATVAVANGGLTKLARRYRNRAITAADRTNDQSARAYCFMGCGLFHQGFGEWQVLDELLTEAAQIFERIGDRYRWQMTINQHAYALMHQGHFDRAREMLDQALRSTDVDETLQVPIIAISGLLMIDLAGGNIDTTRLDQLKQLAVRADQMVQPSDSILASGVLAMAELHNDCLDAAMEIAGKAARRVSFTPPPSFYTYRSLAAIAEVYLEDCRRKRLKRDLGGIGQADRRVRGSLKVLARFVRFFPIAQPRLLRLQGEFETMKGRQRSALDLFSAALSASERLAMPYESELIKAVLSSARQSPPQH